MIVCMCNNVSDKKIRLAVDAGVTSMNQLRETLGVGDCCGKCKGCAKQVLRECMDASAGAPHFSTHTVMFEPRTLSA